MNKNLLLTIITVTITGSALAFLLNTTNEPIKETIPSQEKSEQNVIAPTPDEEGETIVGEPYFEPIDLKKHKTIVLSKPKIKRWWHNATIYQIWIRSFKDSDGDGNGDIQGIIDQLDYIQSLNVDAIWLSPAFESPSYHGYDTSDFYAIETDYGTMEDFDSLLLESKKRGIKVILDFVINHVSDQHPWFQQSLDGNQKYVEFFNWRDTLPEKWGLAWGTEIDPELVWHKANNKYYYSVFSESQPDLNFKNPTVVSEIKNIAKFWLDKGVDGFRLDAIRYLLENGGMDGQADTPENVAFWADFSSFVNSINEDALLVGEALSSLEIASKYYAKGDGLDSAFDFNFNYVIESAIKGDEDQLNEVSRDVVASSVKRSIWKSLEQQKNTNDTPDYYYSLFLNNHDIDRISYRLNNDSVRTKIAASMLLTLPSTSYIYYGEEIGMAQYQKGGDDMYKRGLMQWSNSTNAGFNSSNERWIDSREWFPWLDSFSPWWEDYWNHHSAKATYNVETQSMDNTSILNHYKKLTRIKKNDPIIHSPDSITLFENTDMTWLLEYRKGSEGRWIVLNLDSENRTDYRVPEEIEGTYIDMLTDKNITLTGNASLEPGEIYILKSSS